jgi:EmrB/QacA subfamily drug resistance transporter
MTSSGTRPPGHAGTQAAARRVPDRLDPALIRLALVLMLGGLAAGLDTTIVNVTISTLSRHFDASVASVQWVSTAYLLALTMIVPVTAWAADRYGARRLWLCSLGVFLLGSMLCGAAWSMTALIAFRVLQGLGGGMLLPLIRMILARAADQKQLGRAMVFVAVPGSLTPVLGPVLGGLVVQNLGWRWAFYINLPICVAGLVLAWLILPAEDGRPAATRLDLRGLLMLALGLAAIVYGLSEAGTGNGFTATAIATLATGVALLAAYAVHALRTSTTPVIDLRLFRVRSFTASSALLFLLGGSLFGAVFLLPLYYQQARHASVLQAGLLLAPLGIGMSVGMSYVGKLIDRTGAERAITLAGMALAALGLVPFAVAASRASQLLLAVSLVITGLGLGTVMLAAFTATYRGLTPEQFGPATGANRILQQTGGVLGTAVLAVVLQDSARGHSLASAFAIAFSWALTLTALAVIPAFALPRPGRES